MQTFLNLVATDLHQKLNGNLAHTALVFPNKRAGLFFNQQLAKQHEGPLWAPTYLSISELFQQLSSLRPGDPLQLVCELYTIFKQETGSEETLDDFYFWGELLIGDLDDLDKNLVDAKQLFSNLSDLKKLMDGHDYLSEEQAEAIRQFFQNFSLERRTELKERFISLWDKLGGIYQQFHQRLSEWGIAYEGMLYREALERLDTDALPFDRYVFVGFNVLNKVEIALFKRLQAAGKAMFYWDYDLSYTRIPQQQGPPFTHEAGEFIFRNLKNFPNELPESMFDVLRKPKEIRFIATPTESAAARYLPKWIESLEKEGEKPVVNQETAVVLCNEALLSTILHSIPTEVQKVNITMGFPLTQTPVYSFLNALLELHINGYRPSSGRYVFDAVISLLKHPYTRRISPHAEQLERQLTQDNRFFPLPSELQQDEFLELIFTHREGNLELCRQLTEAIKHLSTLYRKPEETEESNEEEAPEDVYDQLYRESLFKAFTLVTRLSTLIESGEMAEVKSVTLKRLLTKLFTSANIPFHGEPVVGMQIMGVLETRNLDFRNLIMLSLNEGQLPKAGSDSSFIPYNLRKAFGMTTIEHKNSVYAYYFYRLMQRAEYITLLYNTSSDGLNRGEMSRFMLQLLAEYPHEIQRFHLEAEQSPLSSVSITVEKSPEVMNRMLQSYDLRLKPEAFLSPSALNSYLDCKLMFYYRYVAHLKSPEEVSAEIDSALFGTIFHRSAELIYQELTRHGKEVRKEDIERLLKEEVRIQAYVDNAFKEAFFHVTPQERPEYNGTQLINSKVIVSYLKQLLRNDLQYAPFCMEGMEESVEEVLEIATGMGILPLKIGGTIDRMDSKEDTLRIVDYKTGGSPMTPESIEQLFTPAENRPGYILQTFLYAAIMSRKQGLKVAPALLYIHRAAGESYSPVIEMGPARQAKTAVTNFAFYEEEFRERLTALLQEIFDASTPFTQTENDKRCVYCDFKRLCKR